MSTVIEHRDATSDNGLGTFLGIILLLVIAALFFLYAVPYLGNAVRGPSVQIPNSIDVNVKNP